ncbi:MAG: glycosyltransferase family 39 protein [Planctomycetes bacterium]|nr:glycosyltransferase family 39 protein [Planctomycetota bacterium]
MGHDSPGRTTLSTPTPGAGAALLLVVLAAAAVRIAFAFPRHLCFGDQACYIWLGRNLLGGLGYTYYAGHPEVHFPPLFPIALGLLDRVLDGDGLCIKAAYVIFGSLLPIPVFFLGRVLLGHAAGLLAAFLTALLPAFVAGTLFETLSEPLYLLCLFGGISFAYHATLSQRLGPYALAGALLALACLTRSEGTVYFDVVFAYAALVLLVRRPLRLSAAAGRLAVLGGAFLLVMSPYVLYLHGETGQWTLSTKTTTTYTTTRGLVHHDGAAFQRDTWGLDEDGEVRYFARKKLDVGLLELLRGPYRDRVIPDVRQNLLNLRNTFLRPWVFGRWLLALALLGLVGSLVLERRRLDQALNALLVAPLAGVLLLFVAERFLYGALLPLVLWAAAGLMLLSRLLDRVRGPAVVRVAKAAVRVAALVAVAAYLLRASILHLQNQKKQREAAEAFEAAAWLEENTPGSAVVMATGPEVAFHAGRRWLPVPVASLDDVLRYAEKHRATHLCLRGRYLALRPDQKRELFDEARSREGLELLARVSSAEGGTSFVVYKLSETGGGGGAGPR